MTGSIVVLPEAFLAREDVLREKAERGWFEDEDIALCLAEIDRLRVSLDIVRPIVEAARWVVSAEDEDEGGEWDLSHEELRQAVEAFA